MNAELKSKIETYLKKSKATVGKEIIEALRTEYLDLQETYNAIDLQYNSDCERLREIINSRNNEVSILRNVANEFKEDNNSVERKLKFYKIGFYSSLAIIVLLGLLLVA